MPAPIKDAASIQKLFFQLRTMVHFTQNYLLKYSKNRRNSGKRTNLMGGATIQERLLLTRVRYSKMSHLNTTELYQNTAMIRKNALVTK